MQTFKFILVILLSAPIWILFLSLCGKVMDYLCNAIERPDASWLYQFIIVPIAGLFVAFVIPMVFIGLGTLVYSLLATLFGID